MIVTMFVFLSAFVSGGDVFQEIISRSHLPGQPSLWVPFSGAYKGGSDV